MNNDYYIEFYDVVDDILNEYVDKNVLPSYVKIALFEETYGLRERYNAVRLSGKTLFDCIKWLKDNLLPKSVISIDEIKPQIQIPLPHSLTQVKHRLIFYIYNTRQLHYLLPLIDSINRPVVLLCEPGVNLDIEVSDTVKAIELTFSVLKNIPTCDRLSLQIGKLRDYYILFNSLIKCLAPEGIVLLEGCHYQEHILGEIALKNNFPAILIQQGWPSVMHSMFRRFPYSHFLTWGEGFNKLWKFYNPLPQYIAVGYPYPVHQKCGDAIAFFLQSPLFVSNENYFLQILDLITETAIKYPNRIIFVREHPEYQLEQGLIRKMKSYLNIHFVSDIPLAQVFATTKIIVSHFSSALMEGIAHGCIPIVYTPSEFIYNPHIEALGLGMMAKTKDLFFKKLSYILRNETRFVNKISCSMSQWFEAVSKKAILNINIAINRIVPVRYLANNATPRLNLGCGQNIIEGWLNADLHPHCPEVFQMNAGKRYPFPDEAFDYVYSEHMFEHLTCQQQLIMLKECFRILKRGGIMRLAMPNFQFLMNLFNNPQKEINQRYLRWSYETFMLPCLTETRLEDNLPVYVINNFMRDWGHKFIHTPNSLSEIADKIGFQCIVECKVGQSNHLVLQHLENHKSEIPEWVNNLETFVMEMQKSSK